MATSREADGRFLRAMTVVIAILELGGSDAAPLARRLLTLLDLPLEQEASLGSMIDTFVRDG